MLTQNSELRQSAWEAMTGNWKPAVLASLVIGVIFYIGAGVFAGCGVSSSFGVSSFIYWVFIFALVMPLHYSFVQSSRGRQCPANENRPPTYSRRRATPWNCFSDPLGHISDFSDTTVVFHSVGAPACARASECLERREVYHKNQLYG